MRIFLIFIFVLINGCAVTNEPDYVSFRIGADKFNSRDGTFERSLCNESDVQINISLSFTHLQKVEVLRLAKLDISDGNSDSEELEKICVSSYPYEIVIHSNNGLKTTCFSPLQDDESRIANFVYALESIQKVPKSSCRFH